MMEKITSFTVNHLLLEPGVYVSRIDRVGTETVTSFDLRFTSPNREPVMNTAPVHAIEHLAATFLRNDPEWKDRVLYFGPMGCRTGFYLLLLGEHHPEEILPLLKRCCRFILDFSGEIPGARPRDCGNYSDMNLDMAKWWAGRYLRETLEQIDEAHMNYPD